MKTASPDLFQLLKSLTPLEIRHIRGDISANSGSSTALFDTLLAMKVYDEKLLLFERNPKNGFKNLPELKHSLMNQVLESLCQLDKSNNYELSKRKISHARKLFEKGLPRATFFLCRRIFSQTQASEFFDLSLEIIQLQKILLPVLNDPELLELDALYKSEAALINQQLLLNDYWYWNQKMYHIQLETKKMSSTNLNDHIQTILSQPLFKNTDLLNSNQAALFYFQTHALANFITGHTSSAFNNNQNALGVLEENPKILERYPERYISILNNLLIDSLMLKMTPAFLEGLEKLKSLPHKSPFNQDKNIDARIFRLSTQLEINFHLDQKKYTEALQLLPKLSDGLTRYGKLIPRQYLQTFQYFQAYIFFLNERYEDALIWVNKILSGARESKGRDILYYAQILNLLIHSELKNWQLLDSLIPLTRKNIRANASLGVAEVQVFTYLNNSIRAVKIKEIKELKSNWLQLINESPEQKELNDFLNFIDLRSWLEKTK